MTSAPPAPRLGLDITPEPLAPPPPPPWRPSSRLVAAVAGALTLVLAAVVAVVALRPPAHSDEPVVLPETLLGMGPADPRFDFGDDREWQQAQSTALSGAFGGRAYSARNPVTPQVNLVVTREDVSDDEEGDVAMAAGVEQRFGEVACTQVLDGFDDSELAGLDLPEGPYRSENVLICWRSRSDLTVSALVVGFGGAAFTTADVAAAVDEVWALQG